MPAYASNNQDGLWITNAGNTGNVNTGWTSLGAPTTEAHGAAEWEYWRAKVSAAAFSSGPVLTMGLSQINVLDVTGDEDSWL